MDDRCGAVSLPVACGVRRLRAPGWRQRFRRGIEVVRRFANERLAVQRFGVQRLAVEQYGRGIDPVDVAFAWQLAVGLHSQ